MVSVFLTQSSGFLGPVAKGAGFILDKLYEFLMIFGIENIAISIILFTLVTKILLLPMAIKQQKSMRLNQIVQPEIMKLNEKYKNKTDQASQLAKNQEMQQIYAKHGTTPFGSCLPTLIQLPIIFALYNVIRNIPAYVMPIKNVYENIVAQLPMGSETTTILAEYAKAKAMNPDKMDFSLTNTIIDVISKFNTADWEAFKLQFSSIADTLSVNIDKVNSMNSLFGGLNISDAPGIFWPGILIPLLSFVTQLIQVRHMQKSQTTSQTAANDQTAQSMKMMNNIMPVMSAVICITLPIGLGIYWIANSVFSFIQQVAINAILDKQDINKQ